MQAKSPARESNPVLAASKTAVRPAHSRGSMPKSALARSRTWSATFGGSRAIPSHSKGRRITGPAGMQGFEPCPRVLEARCSPRSTPLSRCIDDASSGHRHAAGSCVRNLAQLSIRAPCAA